MVRGTLEGRRKGGIISQQRRREEPEKYRRLGCNVKKNFAIPPHSEALAEVVGIILGDGTIARYQVKVTLDRHRDKEYAEFVAGLMGSILGERPSSTIQERDNTITLTISGIGLVEVLEKIGMKKGDKMANQVSFPGWIRENFSYRAACVRGLFDTDGGLYFHQKAKKKYLGWCFASFSKPLLDDFAATLREYNFNVRKVGEHKLYMYSMANILRYMEVIGSHNPKNARKVEIRRGA
jgi:LAGLIDADG-like domain